MFGNLPGGVQNGTPLGKLDSLCGSCKTAYWRCLGQAKCILVMPERALARFWSAQTRLECPGMRSHPTSVNENAIWTCRKALSLDVCRARRILTIKERALARRVSIHFHCRDSEHRLAHFCLWQLDVLGRGSNVSHTLSLDTCRSKCSRTLKPLCS